MNSFDINCQICYNKFDQETRIPRILSNCGHTICSVCILKILDEVGETRLVTCPFDKKKFFVRNDDIENFNRNFALLQIIEEQNTQIRDMCQIHNKKKANFCLSERMPLCPDCANEQAHEGHVIYVTEEIKQKVNERATCLKGLVNDIVDSGVVSLKKIIVAGSDKQKALLASIDKKFQDYINLVNARKNELRAEVLKYLNQLQTEAEDKYTIFMADDAKTKKMFMWKEKAEKMLEKWNAPDSYGIVPEMLEEKVEAIREDIKVWKDHIQERFDMHEFYKKVDHFVVSYSDEDLAVTVKEFCQLKYNGEVEKVVVANLEEVSDNDISIGGIEKEHDGTDYGVFMLQDHFVEQAVQMNVEAKRKMANANLALDKLFKKNKINYRRKTESLEKTLVLAEDTAPSKKPFLGAYFSKPNLRALQDVNSLNVVCEKLDNNLIKGFSDSIVSLTHLQSLQIQFSNTFSLYDFSNKAIVDYFTPALGRLGSLTSLEIDLKECSRLKDDGLTAIGKTLEKLPKISKLMINLPRDGAYTDKGLLELGQGISTLRGLKHLKVKVLENSNVTVNKLAVFCCYVVKGKELEVLHLDIGRTKDIRESDLKAIAESIENVIEMRELWLKLSPKDGPTVKQLSAMISKMRRLRTLGVEIHDMKPIGNEEVVGLSEAIGKLPDLNKLHLYFEKWRVSMDNVFPKIGLTISGMKSLAALSIHMRGCTALSKNAVQGFCLHIKEIVNLVEFVFKTDKMDDATAGQLCYFLASLRKLRRLCLDLTGCTDIKDSTLQILSSSVEQIGLLSHLELTFKECISITEKGIMHLLDTLANKDELSLISLGLLDCNVTDKTLVGLSKVINQLGKLKRVKIDLSGSNGVTDEGVKKVASLVANESDKLYMACVVMERCLKIGNEGRKALEELKKLLETKENLCSKVVFDGDESVLPKSSRLQAKSFAS